MSLILKEKNEHILTLTINRPEALNALNKEMLEMMKEAFSEAEKDEDVYVVILTGVGKAFVAGADISYMQCMNSIEAKSWSKFGNSVFSAIENMSKPVIAAINGFALGGGCELAMSCDIRIASEKAKFGQPEVGLGVTPGFGGTQRLPRIVGVEKAKELLFTGDIITADEALKIKLISKVVPVESLMEEAYNIAKKITKNAQIAVRQCKDAVNVGMNCDMGDALIYEAEIFGTCFSTEDQREGMTAFVEKRKVTSFKNK